MINFIHIQLTDDKPYQIIGRGWVYSARITASDPKKFDRDLLSLLTGQSIPRLGILLGVEAFALRTVGEGSPIGLLVRDQVTHPIDAFSIHVTIS